MTYSDPSRERKRLADQIDALVGDDDVSALLGRLVKQALTLRYFDAKHDRLNDLIIRVIEARVQELVAFYIKEWDDSLWEGVKTRLEGVHLGALGAAITDQFMDDLAKGRP